MTTTEVKPMVTKYTQDLIKCEICQQFNNFLYKVVQEGPTYYLGTFCPRSRCGHCHEFSEISYRLAQPYLQTKSN